MDREKLAAAFEEWVRRINQEPEKFAKEYGEPKAYGVGAADYLLKLLAEQGA
ncbi:MAG TPA: hypothetical protein VEJ63_00755 [Planctomycetota bacterium]|nr:hypothetical protein [Planctomycetota bacterium]